MNANPEPPATLGERLRLIRIECFGPDGVADLAQRLRIAPQTWKNYEVIGELVPAAHLRQFVELTGANPLWLLRGLGPKYRRQRTQAGNPPDAAR